MVLHKHHKIPRHAGGTDDPNNIEMLTVEQHAEAHRVLFERHGRWQDKCAWLLLAGWIGREDAWREIRSRTHLGKPKSLSHRLKIFLAKTGKKMSQQACENMRIAQLGKKHSAATRLQIGRSQVGKKIDPEAIKKYIVSRQKTDGRKVVVEGIQYPSPSAAAHAVKDAWGVSWETARGRIRHLLRTDIERRRHADLEKARRDKLKTSAVA